MTPDYTPVYTTDERRQTLEAEWQDFLASKRPSLVALLADAQSDSHIPDSERLLRQRRDNLARLDQQICDIQRFLEIAITDNTELRATGNKPPVRVAPTLGGSRRSRRRR